MTIANQHNTEQNTKLITTKITSDEGIQGLSIEIDGRGADFYADGSYCAWDGDGAFSRCEATDRLTPYVSRNAIKAGIAAAERCLGVTFAASSIGVYVDEDGTVDPLHEIA
jgi:hypothetical protein